MAAEPRPITAEEMREAKRHQLLDEAGPTGLPLRELCRLRRQPWWRMVDPQGRSISSFGGGPDIACAQAEAIMVAIGAKALLPR
jgi:hypothetical protein